LRHNFHAVDLFFFSSRRRHTRSKRDWSSDVCSSDLGSVSQPILTEITKLLHSKDAKETLILLDQLIQEGKDPGRFVFDLIYFLRDMLLYKSAPDLEGMLERVLVDEDFKHVCELTDATWIQ